MQSELGHIAFHMMRKLMQEHTASWQQAVPGLTKPQYAVMFAVAEKPGVEQSELMGPSVSTKATLAEILARLEKRDLIYRKQGESDKRRRFVYLTEEGMAVFEQAKASASQVDEHFLSRMSAEDQQEFIRLMKCMTEQSSPLKSNQ